MKLKEMKSALTALITEEADVAEVVEAVRQRAKDGNIPDVEVVRNLWDALMDAVQWSGKNQQQNANSALRQVSAAHWRRSFSFFSLESLSFFLSLERRG